MSRFIVPLIVFSLLVLVLMIGLTHDPRALPSPFLQKPAPQFELPSLQDPARLVGSADYGGEAALVNIWATWCVGCRQEHEYLMQLAALKVINIYGINWRDDRSEALRWLQQLGNPYVFSAFDEDARVGIDWGAYGAPETFLVSADGIVLHKHLGPLDEVIWQRDFVPLLTGDGPAP